MQNVRPTQIKTAIILTLDEYKEVVNTLVPHTYVHCETDGLWYERDEGFPEVEEEELRVLLAQHFDVFEVTSIHIDDCDFVGVWIVYKEHPPVSKENECGEFDCVRNKFGVCSVGSCPEMDAVRAMLRKEEQNNG